MDIPEYRKTLGCFMTGVTVVSTLDDEGAPWGLTANSFTSVSLEPPIILVCLAKAGRAYPTFVASDIFAVNFLAAHQQNIATHFAGQSEDRFANADWTRREAGAPLLAETAAWLDCAVHKRIDAGSHEILMGEVMQFGQNPHEPLGYCDGRFIGQQPLKEMLHV